MMPSKNNYPFYVVMEQTTPVGAKAEIIDEHKGSNGEVNFIRFRQWSGRMQVMPSMKVLHSIMKRYIPMRQIQKNTV